MSHIREILQQVELHDSALESLTAKGDGSLELYFDFDDVWNKELDSRINGIQFNSVYEISDYKIDRFNVIGSIEVEDLEGYDKQFVTHCSDGAVTTMVSIEFVAGGSLNIVCSGSAELLQCRA